MNKKNKRYICCNCSILCDDIELTIENNSIIDTYNCCGRGDIIYKSNNTANRIKNPFINVDGNRKEITFNNAIIKAKEILQNAKNPIIYGFTNTGCEEIFQGILLTRKLNAYIDTQQSVCFITLNKKLKEKKLRYINLDKLKNVVDLIVFWGSNVSDLHLRLASKYAVFPRSGIIQGGKESRTVVSIDIRPTPTEKISDISYYINPGKDKELIDALLELNSGKRIQSKEIAGIPLKKVKDFYELLRDSENKVIFIGPGLTAGGEQYELLDSIAQLAKEMNINLLITTSDINTVGCDFIMRAMTGHPFSVKYLNGKPTSNFSEFSIAKLIKNNKIDAAVIVSADPLAKLPFKLAKKLANIPIIVIDHHKSLTSDFAKVVIPMGMSGIENSGTFMRMDGKIQVIDKILDPPDNVKSGSKILKELRESLE